MPDVRIDHDAVAKLGNDPQIRQACLDVAKSVVEAYSRKAPGTVGESAKALYSTDRKHPGAVVIVKSRLAHIYEFGAPGHLYYGRGEAPIAAQGWLRNSAQEATGMQLRGDA